MTEYEIECKKLFERATTEDHPRVTQIFDDLVSINIPTGYYVISGNKIQYITKMGITPIDKSTLKMVKWLNDYLDNNYKVMQ